MGEFIRQHISFSHKTRKMEEEALARGECTRNELINSGVEVLMDMTKLEIEQANVNFRHSQEVDGIKFRHSQELAKLKLQKRANDIKAEIETDELKVENERLRNHIKLVNNLVSALTTTDKAIQPELISAITAVVKSFKPTWATRKIEFEDVAKKMTEFCEGELDSSLGYFDEGEHPGLTAQPTTRSAAYELILQWREDEWCEDVCIPEGTNVLWTITDDRMPVYDIKTRNRIGTA